MCNFFYIYIYTVFPINVSGVSRQRYGNATDAVTAMTRGEREENLGKSCDDIISNLPTDDRKSSSTS